MSRLSTRLSYVSGEISWFLIPVWYFYRKEVNLQVYDRLETKNLSDSDSIEALPYAKLISELHFVSPITMYTSGSTILYHGFNNEGVRIIIVHSCVELIPARR